MRPQFQFFLLVLLVLSLAGQFLPFAYFYRGCLAYAFDLVSIFGFQFCGAAQRHTLDVVADPVLEISHELFDTVRIAKQIFL